MKLNYFTLGQCEMSAEFFRLSCEKGYDSYDFITKLLTSELGHVLYHGITDAMWLCPKYLMETLEYETSETLKKPLKHGETINPDIMEWIGYLIRIWSLEHKEDTPLDILEQAPPEIMASSYLGFHVLSYEDAILNFKELYAERQKAPKENNTPEEKDGF